MNKRDDLAEKIVQNRLLTFVYKIPPAQGPPFKNTRKLLSARNLRSVGKIFFRESIVKIDVTFFRVCCSKTSAKKYRQQQTTFSWLHTRLVCCLTKQPPCLTKQPPPHVLTSRSIKRFALRNTKRCFGDKQNETLLKRFFFFFKIFPWNFDFSFFKVPTDAAVPTSGGRSCCCYPAGWDHPLAFCLTMEATCCIFI
jgi:hypothetical protein